jgi:putative transposase
MARLMRQRKIAGATRAKKRFTTKRDPAALRAPDLLQRDFSATAPNGKWVCDFTYASTWSGIVYVAFVTDVFSRRLVGWKAARTMTATLVLDALNMAAWTRRHRHWPVSCVTPMRGRDIRPSPTPSDWLTSVRFPRSAPSGQGMTMHFQKV